MCFSVVRPDSMENVKTKWIPELNKFLPNTPIVLVGTQCDIRDTGGMLVQQTDQLNDNLTSNLYNNNSRNSSGTSGNSKNYVTTKEGEDLAKRIRAFRYIECSALTQQNINEVFESCIVAYKQAEMPVKENCFRSIFTSCIGSRFNSCSGKSNSNRNKTVSAKYKKK